MKFINKNWRILIMGIFIFLFSCFFQIKLVGAANVTLTVDVGMFGPYGGGPYSDSWAAITGSGLNCYGSGEGSKGGANVCSITVAQGTQVTLNANANIQFNGDTLPFLGWNNSPALCNSNSCTFTVYDSRTVLAEYSNYDTLTPNYRGYEYFNVFKQGSGTGAVVSIDHTGAVTNNPINCGSTCLGGPAVHAPPYPYYLIAIPDSGSSFSDWSGICTPPYEGFYTGGVTTVNGTPNVCWIGNYAYYDPDTGLWTAHILTAIAVFNANNQTLSVSQAGNGSGTITSSPSGINCGGTCSASFNYGTAVTLTASPSSGSFFAGWSGACSGTGSCAVTMASAQNVTATFNLTKPHISLSPSSFTFSATLGSGAPSGQTMNISNSGTAALNWSGSTNQSWCHLSSTSGSIAVGKSANVTISVDALSSIGSFSCVVTISDSNADNSPQTTSVIYNVSAGNCPAGTVILSPSSIAAGQTSTASAPSGFSGGTFSSNNQPVATVSGSTVTGFSQGSAVISGSGWSYPSNGATGCSLNGASLTVGAATITNSVWQLFSQSAPATPLSGYTRTCTSACDYGGVSTLAAGNYFTTLTVTNSLGKNASISQNFTVNPILTVTEAGTGLGTVTGGGINCPGTCSTSCTGSITLNAVPSSGSTFAGWSGDCSGTGSCTVTCSGNANVTASFNSSPPDFSLFGSNAIYTTVVPGGSSQTSNNTTITVTPFYGFSSQVSLSSNASSVISGASDSFSKKNLSQPNYSSGSAFNVTVPASTPTGLYSITITGNGGGLTRTTTVNFNVTSFNPNWKEF